jgi:hypothetical protein
MRMHPVKLYESVLIGAIDGEIIPFQDWNYSHGMA